MVDPKEKRKKLHAKLVEDQLYSKSYEDFETQFSNPEKIQALYDNLKNDDLISMSPEEYSERFFGDILKKKDLGTEGSGTSSGTGDAPAAEKSSKYELPKHMGMGSAFYTYKDHSDKVNADKRKKSLIDFYDKGADVIDQPDGYLNAYKNWATENGSLDRITYLEDKARSEVEDARRGLSNVTQLLNKLEEDKRQAVLAGDMDKVSRLNKDIQAGVEHLRNNKDAAQAGLKTEAGLQLHEEAVGFTAEMLNNKMETLLTPETEKKLTTLESLQKQLESMTPDKEDRASVEQYNHLVEKYNTLLQDEDVQQVKRVADQGGKLVESEKELAKKFPNEFTKRLEKKARQEQIDDMFASGKTAKIGEPPTSWMMNQLGRSATGFVADVLKSWTVFDHDAKFGAADKYNSVIDNAVDYVNDSAFPIPSDFNKPMMYQDDNGNTVFRKDLILPKAARVAGDMAGLLFGAGKLSALGKAAGLSRGVSNGIGLFASSYLQTHDDYKKAGQAAGLSPAEAAWFATTGSAVTSTLEMISPQKYLWGSENLAKSVAKYIRSGMSKSDALKESLKFFAKETGAENLQEMTQLIGDKLVESGVNRITGNNHFEHNAQDILNEAVETLVLTSVVAGVPASIKASADFANRNKNYRDAIRLAAENKEKYIPLIQKTFREIGAEPAEIRKVFDAINAVKVPKPGTPLYLIHGQTVDRDTIIKHLKKKNLDGVYVANDKELEGQLQDVANGGKFRATPKVDVKRKDEKSADGKVKKEDPVDYAKRVAEAKIHELVKTGDLKYDETGRVHKLTDHGEQQLKMIMDEMHRAGMPKKNTAYDVAVEAAIEKQNSGKPLTMEEAELLESLEEDAEFVSLSEPTEKSNPALEAAIEKQNSGQPLTMEEADLLDSVEEMPQQNSTPEGADQGTVDEDVSQEEAAEKAAREVEVDNIQKVIGLVVKALSKIQPNLKVVYYDGEDAGREVLKEAKSRAKLPAGANGFYAHAQGIIGIDISKADTSTAFHEGFHPLIDSLKELNPELFKKLSEQAANQKVEMKDGTFKTYLEYMGGNKEEALVEFLADYADNKFDPSNEKSLAKTIKDIINQILEALGLKAKDFNVDLDDVQSLREFADQMATAISGGKTINLNTKAKAIAKRNAKSKVSGQVPHGEKKSGNTEDDTHKLKQNLTGATQGFFTAVVEGTDEKFKPKAPWVPLMTYDKDQGAFKEQYDKFTGNFDQHIATSIPGFRDVQVKKGAAITKMLPNGGLVYDIGGSEGGFVKTITQATKGKIKTINLDVNESMQKAHESAPVEGSEFVNEAFLEPYEEDGKVYPRHKPKQKADVVHESMVFQFISPERKQFIQEIKNNYLKSDGAVILEEKVVPESEQEWLANEDLKDTKFKSKYYSSAAVEKKREEVLIGMKKNQTADADLQAELLDNFDYVYQYWDSGNFKGYIASNDKSKIEAFAKSLGDTKTEFSTRENGYLKKGDQVKNSGGDQEVSAQAPTGGKKKKLNRTAKRIAYDTMTQFKKLRVDIVQNPQNHMYTPQQLKRKAIEMEQMTLDEVVQAQSSDVLIEAMQQDTQYAVLSAIELLKRKNAAGEDTRPVFKKLRQLGTSVGQLLRQFGELKTRSVEGVVNTVLGNLESMNMTATEEQTKTLTTLADEHIKALADQDAKRITFTHDASDANLQALEEAEKRVAKSFYGLNVYVGKITPFGLDSILPMILQGSLLVVKSGATNVVGNWTYQPFRQSELLAGDLATYVSKRMSGEKMVNPLELFFGSMLNGIVSFGRNVPVAIRDATRGRGAEYISSLEVRRNLKPLQALQQLFTAEGRKTLPVNLKGKVPFAVYAEKVFEGTAGWPAELMFRMLYLGDKPFREAGRTAAAYRMFREQGGKGNTNFRAFLANMSAKEHKAAEEAAQESTFSNKRTLSNIGDTYTQMSARAIEYATAVGPTDGFRYGLKVLFKVIAKTITPYVRVPANLLQYMLELALPEVTLAGGLAFAYRSAKSKESDLKDKYRRKSAGLITRAFTGFMLQGAIDMMYDAGLLLASGEDDEEVERQLKHGVARPNGLNISAYARWRAGGDATYQENDDVWDFTRFGVLGMYMTYRAEYNENLQKELKKTRKEMGGIDKFFEKMEAVTGAGLSFSFLQGQYNVLNAFDKGGLREYGADLLNTMSTIVLPNNLSVISRANSEYILRAKDESVMEMFMEKQKIKLFPTLAKLGLSDGKIENTYPIIGMFGEPALQTPKGKNAAIYHFFNIANSEKIDDPLYLEVYKVSKGVGEIPITAPSEKVKIGPTSFTLSEQDYTYAQMLAGQYKRIVLEAFIQEPSWNTYTDEEKKLLMEDQNTKANEFAKEYMTAMVFEGINLGRIVADEGRGTYNYIEPSEFDINMATELFKDDQ